MSLLELGFLLRLQLLFSVAYDKRSSSLETFFVLFRFVSFCF